MTPFRFPSAIRSASNRYAASVPASTPHPFSAAAMSAQRIPGSLSPVTPPIGNPIVGTRPKLSPKATEAGVQQIKQSTWGAQPDWLLMALERALSDRYVADPEPNFQKTSNYQQQLPPGVTPAPGSLPPPPVGGNVPPGMPPMTPTGAPAVAPPPAAEPPPPPTAMLTPPMADPLPPPLPTNPNPLPPRAPTPQDAFREAVVGLGIDARQRIDNSPEASQEALRADGLAMGAKTALDNLQRFISGYEKVSRHLAELPVMSPPQQSGDNPETLDTDAARVAALSLLGLGGTSLLTRHLRNDKKKQNGLEKKAYLPLVRGLASRGAQRLGDSIAGLWRRPAARMPTPTPAATPAATPPPGYYPRTPFGAYTPPSPATAASSVNPSRFRGLAPAMGNHLLGGVGGNLAGESLGLPGNVDTPFGNINLPGAALGLLSANKGLARRVSRPGYTNAAADTALSGIRRSALGADLGYVADWAGAATGLHRTAQLDAAGNPVYHTFQGDERSLIALNNGMFGDPVTRTLVDPVTRQLLDPVTMKPVPVMGQGRTFQGLGAGLGFGVGAARSPLSRFARGHGTASSFGAAATPLQTAVRNTSIGLERLGRSIGDAAAGTFHPVIGTAKAVARPVVRGLTNTTPSWLARSTAPVSKGTMLGRGIGGTAALASGAGLAMDAGKGLVENVKSDARDFAADTAKNVIEDAYDRYAPNAASDLAAAADQYLQTRGLSGPDGRFDPLSAVVRRGGSLDRFVSPADGFLRSIGLNPAAMNPLQKILLLGGGGTAAAGALTGNPWLAGGGVAAGLGGLLPYLFNNQSPEMPAAPAPANKDYSPQMEEFARQVEAEMALRQKLREAAIPAASSAASPAGAPQ